MFIGIVGDQLVLLKAVSYICKERLLLRIVYDIDEHGVSAEGIFGMVRGGSKCDREYATRMSRIKPPVKHLKPP